MVEQLQHRLARTAAAVAGVRQSASGPLIPGGRLARRHQRPKSSPGVLTAGDAVWMPRAGAEVRRRQAADARPIV